MFIVNDILNEIDKIAPLSYAENGDNVGLLIGNKKKKVKKILVTLDITIDVVEEAKEKGVDLIISHHPVIYSDLKSVTPDSANIVYQLLSSGISVITAHTNLDIAPGGVNYELFMLLDMVKMRPLKNADNAEGMSLGLIGELKTAIDSLSFVKIIKKQLNTKLIRYIDGEKDIKTVAICGGSGGSLLDIVKSNKVDAFVTGDLKHHDFVDAYNNGFTLIDAGHYYTENIIVNVLVKYLRRNYDGIEINVAETGKDKVKYVF